MRSRNSAVKVNENKRQAWERLVDGEITNFVEQEQKEEKNVAWGGSLKEENNFTHHLMKGRSASEVDMGRVGPVTLCTCCSLAI